MVGRDRRAGRAANPLRGGNRSRAIREMGEGGGGPGLYPGSSIQNAVKPAKLLYGKLDPGGEDGRGAFGL